MLLGALSRQEEGLARGLTCRATPRWNPRKQGGCLAITIGVDHCIADSSVGGQHEGQSITGEFIRGLGNLTAAVA